MGHAPLDEGEKSYAQSLSAGALLVGLAHVKVDVSMIRSPFAQSETVSSVVLARAAERGCGLFPDLQTVVLAVAKWVIGMCVNLYMVAQRAGPGSGSSSARRSALKVAEIGHHRLTLPREHKILGRVARVVDNGFQHPGFRPGAVASEISGFSKDGFAIGHADDVSDYSAGIQTGMFVRLS